MACAKLVFLVFLHLTLCCLRCTGKLDFGRWRLFFSGPLYLAVTCSSCLPEEYSVAFFREMTPGMFPVFSALLGSTADTYSASVWRLLEEIHAFLREGRTFGSCVDPRPHDCSKLWSLRSCSSSFSSTSLLWRTGRSPWLLSFFSCSTLIG